MISDMASTQVSSNRGRSKPRTIKSKPRPRFPVRKRGEGTRAAKRGLEVRIVK